jgi:hypothetical protein
MYEDKTLVARNAAWSSCSRPVSRSFYAERGFQNEPQRCKACRDARKAAAPRSARVLHCNLRRMRRRGTCAFSSPEMIARFYCSDCFAKMKAEK